MENFGINLVGIPLYLNGTSKRGVQTYQTWTSEDYDPVMYKKVTPIEKQKDLVYRNKQKQGVKRFDKGFKTLWGVMRLNPVTALGTDIIDGINAVKDQDFNEYALNVYGGGARAFDAIHKNTEVKSKNLYKNVVKYHRAKLGKPLAFGLGKFFALPDIIDDTVDLYNAITE